MNRRTQLVCVWSGFALTILFAIGAVFLGQFIPPLTHPDDSAAVVASKYDEHRDAIRIGAFITIISMSMVGCWGVTMAAQLRRTEGDFPILTYVQIVCVAVGTCVVVLMSMFWEIAAFRPGEYSDETVLVLNDIAYFLFLFTWTPFSIWMIAIALAIFNTPEEQEAVYPRWAAYFCLWVAVLFVGAGLMAFFKDGAFSWAGVVALYIPVGVFFVMLVMFNLLTLRNLKNGAYHGGVPARQTFDTAAPAARPAAVATRPGATE